MQLQQDVEDLTRHLNLGSRGDRRRIQEALTSFFSTRGYTAEFGSFRSGVLLLLAAPAEHALLRYDRPALERHLQEQGLSDLVREVKVRTKTIQAPQK